MGRVLVGTASWTDPTLINSDRFYPPWANTPEARLHHYASQFSLVEVDSAYYALPAEAVARLWVERTGEDFVFDVKSFRLFTHHPTPLKALPRDIRESLPVEAGKKANLYLRDIPAGALDELWRRFEAALLPLDSAGKLGLILFQFPAWFYPGREQFDYILSLRQRLPQYRLSVEFRRNSWLNERNRELTLGLLRDDGLAFVCVDEPQGFESSVPPVTAATAESGVVRFHGRNAETWEKKDITTAERFNYLYSEAELREWLPRIRELASQTQELHLIFNNCYEDKAVINARQMRLMLD